MDSHQIEPYTMKCSDSNPFQWASLSNRTQQTLHDLRRCRPFRRINTPMPPMTFKATSSIFIPSTVTSHLISNDFIRGRFHSTGRLFQFLNWTLRINKSIQSMMVMEGQKKRKVLLFDIELLDSRGQSLYALCTPNITHKPNAQPWCLGALLTADMITKWMDIEYQMLPRGVRAVSPHFEQYRRMKVNLKRMKMEILEIDANQNGNQYSHLRCIRLKHSKNSADKVLYVRFSTFFDIVQSALKSDNVKLVPIVSIVSRQSKDSATNLLDFSVDYLLPVQIQDNWVGVVYRDGQCIMTLMDRYDITNKAIQCDPSFDIQSMDWFTNKYNRLRIILNVPLKESKNWRPKIGSNVHSETASTTNSLSIGSSTRRVSTPSVAGNEKKSNYTRTSPTVPTAGSTHSEPKTFTQMPSVRPSPYHYKVNGRNQSSSQPAQQWIQWTERTIQTAVAEAHYFMNIRRQYIGC